jgi:hypothetical protein
MFGEDIPNANANANNGGNHIGKVKLEMSRV